MSEPLRIRAHVVLCMIGFRGSGYSPEFVGVMRKIQSRLADAPQTVVQLVNEPDQLCSVCPHMSDEGCQLQGPLHESHMRAHDGAVLHRLGLRAGESATWADVLDRIRERIRGTDLPQICTTCPWLPLGVCRESIDQLRVPPPPLWQPSDEPASGREPA